MANVQTRFKPTRARHFIRAWRKYRGLTLEQLAERVEVTHGAISQLERGETNYTQPMLEAIAKALQCTPADLIMRDPNDSSAPWSIWERLEPEQREKANSYLRFLSDEAEDLRKRRAG